MSSTAPPPPSPTDCISPPALLLSPAQRGGMHGRGGWDRGELCMAVPGGGVGRGNAEQCLLYDGPGERGACTASSWCACECLRCPGRQCTLKRFAERDRDSARSSSSSFTTPKAHLPPRLASLSTRNVCTWTGLPLAGGRSEAVNVVPDHSQSPALGHTGAGRRVEVVLGLADRPTRAWRSSAQVSRSEA